MQANAQGLMGLAAQGHAPQGAPQGAPQQPMPSPMKASPMAGLGSVEGRVAAYRGNPAPLQQRYAMSQDMLDLLALQKIKSDKEAAARDMQLKMSQQQQAQGMEPMTVAKQREKEVMDLTKNELAQQRGDTANQQVAQQQEAMKRAMFGGIAAAPGAASAAQPKMMASGGIVAFDGTTGSDVEDPRRMRRGGESLQDYNRRMLQLDLQIRQETRAAENAKREAERQRLLAERGGAAIPPSRLFDRKPLELPGQPTAQEIFDGAPPASPNQSAAETQRPQAENATLAPTVTAPPAAPSNVKAPPVAPAPAMPSRPPAPAAAPAPGAPADGLASLVEKTERGMMQADPAAADRAKQEEIRKLYELSPQQRGVYEEGIAQRRKMFDEAYDPERQRNEGIKQFLLGAGGRRYNVLGGAAQAAGAYDEKQRQAKLKDFEGLQKSREDLIGKEREGIKPSIEGGLAALKESSAGQRSGLESATKRIEGALDRTSREAIARESARVQAAIAQATRDQTLEMNKSRLSQDINKLEERGIAEVQRGPVAKTITNLESLKSINPKGFAKEQQAELDAKYRELEDAMEGVRLRADAYREQIGGFTGKAGAKSNVGTPEQRALVKRYTEGK